MWVLRSRFFRTFACFSFPPSSIPNLFSPTMDPRTHFLSPCTNSDVFCLAHQRSMSSCVVLCPPSALSTHMVPPLADKVATVTLVHLHFLLFSLLPFTPFVPLDTWSPFHDIESLRNTNRLVPQAPAPNKLLSASFTPCFAPTLLFPGLSQPFLVDYPSPPTPRQSPRNPPPQGLHATPFVPLAPAPSILFFVRVLLPLRKCPASTEALLMKS